MGRDVCMYLRGRVVHPRTIGARADKTARMLIQEEELHVVLDEAEA